MEVMGICAICGRAAKLYTCPLCGKLVCGQCMDQKRGMCLSCTQGTRGKPKNSKF
ncbi:MAG: hypothetical protein PHD41_00020 [Methanosarcinaceae archaeon]|nr:hypothetical protein [Methanosarcinaceae archaeon]MDD4332394.1 hypothetical protein [Methanosarcinaceae archaeon]MDD4750130.1 hypothetical protein [Methanosarcinaceae archaeon]